MAMTLNEHTTMHRPQPPDPDVKEPGQDTPQPPVPPDQQPDVVPQKDPPGPRERPDRPPMIAQARLTDQGGQR